MTTRTPIEDMAMAHIKCHAIGHWWDHLSDDNIERANGRVISVTQLWVCRRRGCGETKRVERGSSLHIIGSPRYTPPDGYAMDLGGEEINHRPAAIREWWRRIGIDVNGTQT
jgi:hypothetical protein